MRITYDREGDVLYIQFKKAEVTTTQVTDDIAFDYDGELLAGIEILDASKVLADPTAFKEVKLEELGTPREG